MYKDIFGITQIKEGKVDNLSISVDLFDEPVGVFLYTPWMEETNNHFHVRMKKEEIEHLRDWCNEFLADDVKNKYNTDLNRNAERLRQRRERMKK